MNTLLDSGATGLFMNLQFAKEQGFKLEKLEQAILVEAFDGTLNIEGAITYEVKVNRWI